MKGLNELPGLMVELLEDVDRSTGVPKFPKRATEIVREIAAYAKGTKFYQDNDERAEHFWDDPAVLPEDIFVFMLQKVVNAPSGLHSDCAVLCHMPALEKALDSQRRCRICGCSDMNACAQGCEWVEEDLCSACAGEADNG